MFGVEMEKLKSLLGTQSELQGNLTVKGILRLDGTAYGKIQADQVIVSATGVMNGEVVAGKIIVGGRVEGTLRAGDLVEITSKGKVKGDIYTKRLLIIEGGEFNGNITMKIHNFGDSHHNLEILQPRNQPRRTRHIVCI